MIKSVVRRAMARVTPAQRSHGVRILLYHAIDAPDPADAMGLRVSRELFVKQMRMLRSEGYTVVPLAAACDEKARHNRQDVAITFDDGYRSQAWAADVLREFGFPATIFVVPRFLDGVREPCSYWETWGFLDWDEVARLADEGIDIGAHSATHVDLTTCTPEQLEDEIAGARHELRSRLGRDIVAFSYPHGRYNSNVRGGVMRAGYRFACTSRYGNNASVQSSYMLQRTEVSSADNMQDFQWKLEGKYDWLGHWQSLQGWFRGR